MAEDPARIASFAHQLLRELLAPLEGEVRAEVVERIVELVCQEVGLERRRAAELCRRRADLWQKTSASRASASEAARDEARSRCNEALYLADLIEGELEKESSADA